MAIGPVGATPFIPPTLASSKTAAPSGFGQGLQQVMSLQSAADGAATGVATGSLTDLHQFTAASTKASLAVELTVALRNRAVDAYQEIMRMQV